MYRPNYSTSRNDFFLQPMSFFRAGGRRLPSGLPYHVPGLQPDLLAHVPQFTTRSVKTTSGHSDILTFWHSDILTFWHSDVLKSWNFENVTFCHIDTLSQVPQFTTRLSPRRKVYLPRLRPKVLPLACVRCKVLPCVSHFFRFRLTWVGGGGQGKTGSHLPQHPSNRWRTAGWVHSES